VYFTQNPFYDPSLQTLYSWNFTITTGFNTLSLSTHVSVGQGNLVLIKQITGKIAICTTGNATYSDLVGQTLSWLQLNQSQKNRFYFNPLFTNSMYAGLFSISHQYTAIGLYTVSITFATSSQSYVQVVNITDCRFT